MPVKAVGKKIVEAKSGKTVGSSTSKKKAKDAARIRNMAHAAKQGDKKAQEGMRRLRAAQG